MKHKEKQEWLEAVMADPDLKPVVKVYAFGVKAHMFGNKDESWPGKEAIHAATNLGTGHYSEYSKALADAGYLEVTPRRGTSNLYRLTLPTPVGGNHLHPTGVTVPPTGVTPAPNGGPNPTKNPTKETIKENPTKDASAPGSPSLKSEDIPSSILNQSPTFEEIVSPLLEDRRFSLPETGDAATEGLNKHLVADLEKQVPAIANEEGWDSAFAAQVLQFALDPTFAVGRSAGGRIAAAKAEVQSAMVGESW